MKFFKYLSVSVLAVALVACGGGGGSAGTVPGSTTPTTPTTPTIPKTPTTAAIDATVKDMLLFLDKTIVKNTGSDTAKLTVIALDSNNNVVVGATVNVTSDPGSVTVKSAPVTDSAGTVVATIGTGSDKSDRQINVSATVNGITRQTSFQVVGSRLVASPSSNTPAPNSLVTLNMGLKDSDGIGIASTTLTVSGTVKILAGQTAKTDASGNAVLTFNAPTVNGTYDIKVAGSGTQVSAQIIVSTSGLIPDATQLVTPSFSISPNVLVTNSNGSSINKAALRTLFVDSNSVPIPNVRVRYRIISTGLGSTDSSIATGTNIVHSGSSGAAVSDLISGQTGSANNGVLIKACYDTKDFAPADCPNFVTANLTISAQAVSVSIGDDSLLAKDTGVYIQNLVVTVVDSAGRAVANAPVSFSADITHYGKGQYTDKITYSLSSSDINQAIPDLVQTPAKYGSRVFCPNEDLNRNGIVDSGENINFSVDTTGQPTLEPRAADVSIALADPSVATTNASGKLLLKVTYLQSVATWEVYRIRVTTSVAGSQGLAERAFITNFNVGDDAVGAPFKTPPYGVGSCSEAF